MGLTKPIDKMYLRVNNGRICKTCEATTPEAQKRETSKGETIYELVWESLGGILDTFSFRDHPQFGKSWTLNIVEGDKTFALQINEDSRYGVDILKKIPNLRHGVSYIFKPYDYEKNGKRRAGISITRVDNDEKIESYYQKFTQKEDGSWDVQDLHDFPKFDGDSKDKDDLKIYFVKLAKFLRAAAFAHLSHGFYEAVPEVKKPEEEPAPVSEEPLPF